MPALPSRDIQSKRSFHFQVHERSVEGDLLLLLLQQLSRRRPELRIIAMCLAFWRIYGYIYIHLPFTI